MELKDLFTLMSMEAQESSDWKYDHNTTVLLIMRSNLASLLQACMMISNKFEQPENIDMLGLISGLTEVIEWLQENMILNYKGISDGSK